MKTIRLSTTAQKSAHATAILMEHYRGTYLQLEASLHQIIEEETGVDLMDGGKWNLNTETGELTDEPASNPEQLPTAD